VVVFIVGVVNVLPVNNKFPLVALLYQFSTPDEAVAERFTVPIPHLVLGVVLVTVGVTTAVT
jgi:hypothetical protein